VNTLNFCAFSICYEWPKLNIQRASSSDSVLVAVPSRDDKKIEVYQFPDEKLVSFVPRVQITDTGMVMAVKLAYHQSSNNILVLAGYEGGFTAVHLLDLSARESGKSIPEFAKLIYLSQPHTQPILSLDVTPDASMYFTSSADAIIAAHRIPELPTQIDQDDHDDDLASIWRKKNDAPIQPPAKASHRITEDITPAEEAESKKLPLTENASSSHRPTSPPSSSPPLSSPPLSSTSPPLSFTKQALPQTSSSTTAKAGLSSLLSAAIPSTFPPNPNSLPPPFITAVQPPYKIAQTKHAGQQSLSVRSDGRLFVTGGWDSRIRVYSAKTLKEVACLKWHKEGVYAVGFGLVLGEDVESEDGTVLALKNDLGNGLSKLQRQREEQIRRKHWVVAGSKDGKVSLWEVF
jgi:WD40 repeat protein